MNSGVEKQVQRWSSFPSVDFFEERGMGIMLNNSVVVCGTVLPSLSLWPLWALWKSALLVSSQK